MEGPKYWIAAVSRDHALRGKAGGFIQVCHGKQAPLQRMKPRDWILVYSSKLSMGSETKCQNVTAIGQVIDQEVYSCQMTPGFNPFRRKVHFYDSEEISILPLINELDFIPDKKKWGFAFRFGIFEINEKDFNLIRSKILHYEIKSQVI